MNGGEDMTRTRLNLGSHGGRGASREESDDRRENSPNVAQVGTGRSAIITDRRIAAGSSG